MVLCLVMDVVFLSTLNFIIKHYKNINCYHVHVGTNGENLIQEKCMLDLAGKAETFVLECIETMTANRYWKVMDQCIRRDTEKNIVRM